MTAQDVSLVQKPLTMDILMRIVTDEGQTKAQIMRSYDDLVNRTVHYRLSEMFDMGWIEYRDSVMSANAISATPREMTDGNREWEACNQVTDRIERMYPGADL